MQKIADFHRLLPISNVRACVRVKTELDNEFLIFWPLDVFLITNDVLCWVVMWLTNAKQKANLIWLKGQITVHHMNRWTSQRTRLSGTCLRQRATKRKKKKHTLWNGCQMDVKNAESKILLLSFICMKRIVLICERKKHFQWDQTSAGPAILFIRMSKRLSPLSLSVLRDKHKPQNGSHSNHND